MAKTIKWWIERNYKTKKSLTDEIRNLINQIDDDCFITEEKDIELLTWVLSHHHDYLNKINGSTNFKIRVRRSLVNSGNKELLILRDDGTEIDISWTKALNPQGSSTHKEDLRNAAVQAVNDQIIEFKDKNTDTICCLCKKQIEDKIEACHYEPRLNELLTQFFGNDEEMEKIDIKDGSYASRYFNPELSEKWATFHANQATLKPAHKKCIRQRKSN
ncbi:DUF3223 domain-containing protein [Acinetobacter tandoii]|uniref:DUF3223 domain-containing protein n=1 Tax=Acinetobacter tandoii TaxID=202954 RepID=A0A5N4WUN1_9GAMM|nr:DUF3223 domain-containing protein [Acinetobacter tandoii]KAB1859970.1 DUF3223 domain-containing protein [Acinetobacter tandoii]